MANERDFIWQQQGASSFVKIKMDWARFGKIHFSFVQHSGKPACKQVASIEAALKVDGGDGALYLAEAVKNNTMERRRAKALEDQKASGAKYPAPMFTSMGGTTAQRSKTGQCVFRQVSLVPGMKTDYALQVVEADGEPTATGGISMKKGAGHAHHSRLETGGIALDGECDPDGVAGVHDRQQRLRYAWRKVLC